MIIISTFNLLIHSLLHQKRTSSIVLSVEKTCANFYEQQNQFTLFEKELKECKQSVLNVIDFDIIFYLFLYYMLS
jgi:hypothetical protein